MTELQTALEEYLAVRHALGFELRNQGHLLRDFVRFAQQAGATFITTDLALRWAQLPAGAQPCYSAHRLSVVRRFARYRSPSDPKTEIPPDGLLPHHYRRKTPYLYSATEIVQIIAAAKRLPSSIGLRPHTYSTLFGLLAVTGMRISEPLALDRDDVDLARGVLTIRRTKFHKSRLVPIHASTRRVLSQYARRRDSLFVKPKTPAYFVSDVGTRPSYWAALRTFVIVSHQIGLRGPSDRRGPRLHDLRHAFAVQTLLHWYRTGADVERRLPELATYLGHVHVRDTYWYVSATPELLRWAAKRLDSDKGGLPS